MKATNKIRHRERESKKTSWSVFVVRKVNIEKKNGSCSYQERKKQKEGMCLKLHLKAKRRRKEWHGIEFLINSSTRFLCEYARDLEIVRINKWLKQLIVFAWLAVNVEWKSMWIWTNNEHVMIVVLSRSDDRFEMKSKANEEKKPGCRVTMMIECFKVGTEKKQRCVDKWKWTK